MFNIYDCQVENFEEKLNDYAQLIAKVGLNVKKDQIVCIKCDVVDSYFANKVIDACYEAGAGNVVMAWMDNYSEFARLKYGNDEAVGNLAEYADAIFDRYCGDGASSLRILSNYPNQNEGIDPNRLATYSNETFKVSKNFKRAQMKAEIPWLITRVPNLDWAKLVFPGKSDEDAIVALWDEIFRCVKVFGNGKSVENWNKHIENLGKLDQYLNSLQIRYLHYQNALGTNLTVELPKEHLWMSSCENKTIHWQRFIANIPTEEVFTDPLKTGSNGIVYASKPLVLNGNIIKDFYFEIKDGKIVDAHASEGEDMLRRQLEANPNNSYLGEVALVPYDSSISNSNILFYDTLFDENAACHIAFGNSFPKCIKGGTNMSKEELEKIGINFAPCHEDFMIGTSDLNIVATTWDGREVSIFKNGNPVIA